MAALQGPALIVKNDARFSDGDWENIQQIGSSGKALDATKTGKFGLGFNSVYNVTDFPMLLTGSRLGVFDPHGHTVAGASSEHPGSAWRLDEAIWSECPDLLAPFKRFGLSPNAAELQSTVFRLPLRTTEQAAKSDICQQPFTPQDFDLIVEKLRDQLGDLLIFLRNVQDIDIWQMDERGNASRRLSAQTVNRHAVEQARNQVRQALATDHGSILDALSDQKTIPVVSEFEHQIELCSADGSQCQISYLVVNGLFRDDKGEIVDCARQMLKLSEKAVPLAGAATRWDVGRGEGFQGRVFCALPLPLASPLQSFHVNGFFDLQGDRQGLFQDPGAEGSSAVRVKWNKLLLGHCCSEAAARLCTKFSQSIQCNPQSRYEHWPRVVAQENSMLDGLPRQTYRSLRAYQCIAAGAESNWSLPEAVRVLPSGANEVLRTALLSDNFHLPNPILPGFVLQGFKAAGLPLTILDPINLRALLRVPNDVRCQVPQAPRPCLRDTKWICALLEYCVSDGKIDDLVGVPLAHMSDGMLRAFGRNPQAPVYLAGEDERAIFTKTPHWFIDSSLQAAISALKESKLAGIIRFSPQNFAVNLHKVLPDAGSHGQISAGSEVENLPSEAWLTKAFDYMTSHVTELKLDHDLVVKLPMVPDQLGNLHVMGTANTPLLLGADEPKAFLSALKELGVPLVSGDEKFLKAVRGFIVAFPDLAIWRLSPKDLIDTLSAIQPKDPSLIKTPRKEDASAILDYLSTDRTIKDLKGPIADRAKKLRGLRLFPTTSGQLVSLQAGDYHISADYPLPEVATEVGLLDCGPDRAWMPLYGVLEVPKLTRIRLLTDIVLPRIGTLRDDDIHRTLLWLRSNLQAIKEEESKDTADALLGRLGTAIPIRCTDGQPRPPRLLYHPDSEFVASLLGDQIGFPDLAVYKDRSDLWLDLFAALGMAHTPRPTDILNAIDSVIKSGQPDEAKGNKLAEIAEYINKHWDELKEQTLVGDILKPDNAAHWHLSDALSQRAWLPVIRTAPGDYPSQLLAPVTSNTFQPTKILARSALYLAGSVRPICRIHLTKLQNDIGLRAEPTLADVLTHFEKAGSVADAGEAPVSDPLIWIFQSVYEFLGRHFGNEQPETVEADPDIIAIRRRFALKRCLVDEERHLWQPGHCFADPVPSFLGHRARVRAKVEARDRGLQILGRRDRPCAADYVAFFKELRGAQRGDPVPDTDRNLLRSAYREAASFGDESSFRSCPVLLETGELMEAPTAVLDDAPWLSERAHNAGLRFLDPELGAPVAKAFGVPLLSSAVYEKPEQEQDSHNPRFITECAQLQALLQSKQLYAGVYRLLRALDNVVPEADLRRFFEDLQVISVSSLSTVLVWTDGNEPVERSAGPCDVVFDPARNAVVVSEEANDVLYERVGIVLSNELRHDGHDLRELTGHFVSILRVEPDAIDRHLTKLHVRALPALAEESTDSVSDDLGGFLDEKEVIPESETDDRIGADSAGTTEAEKEPRGEEERRAIPEAPARQMPPGMGQGSQQEVGDKAAPVVGSSEGSSPSEQRPTGGSTATPKSRQAESSMTGPERGAVASKSDHEETARTRAESAGSESQPGATGETGSKSRSDQRGAPPRGRARTYVSPRSEVRSEEPPERQEQRSRVDKAAIRRVLQFEKDNDRRPKEMPHKNQGYDIESCLPNGRLDRYIEVKGLGGPWTDLGVAVSRDQYRKASKENKSFWLYVVEFALEPDRTYVYAIQDPAHLIDEYWFDGGWRDVANEKDGPITSAVKIGSKVIVDGRRRGTVTGIRHAGLLKHLDIDFDDGGKDQVLYSTRRVQIIQTPPEEGTHL